MVNIWWGDWPSMWEIPWEQYGYNLVGVFKHEFYFPFHLLGMSSETHWLSYFSRWLKPPTRKMTGLERSRQKRHVPKLVCEICIFHISRPWCRSLRLLGAMMRHVTSSEFLCDELPMICWSRKECKTHTQQKLDFTTENRTHIRF